MASKRVRDEDLTHLFNRGAGEVERLREALDKATDRAEQAEARAALAEQERDDWQRQCETNGKDALRLMAERDDLGTWSLPLLARFLTEPFDESMPDDALLTDTWPAVHGDKADDYDVPALPVRLPQRTPGAALPDQDPT